MATAHDRCGPDVLKISLDYYALFMATRRGEERSTRLKYRTTPTKISYLILTFEFDKSALP
jgi:hypothetical protein